MVPRERLELSILTAIGSKPIMYTNSITEAYGVNAGSRTPFPRASTECINCYATKTYGQGAENRTLDGGIQDPHVTTTIRPDIKNSPFRSIRWLFF